MISSVQNPRVKSAVRLRERRGRAAQQRIIIDGAREILRAFQAGLRFTECFVCAGACQSADAQKVVSIASQSKVAMYDVSPKVLEKLSFGERAEGIVAVAELPRQQLDDIPVKVDSLIAVVERIEKPGNLGAILRTADAAGVSGVIAADPVCDLFNPNAIRASLGALFTLPIAVATTQESVAWLRSHRFAIYAARVDGSLPYTHVDYSGPAAIILGNESDGLSGQWTGDGITSVSLPMCGVVDSLNVSTTAAILFYEALRQRMAQRPTATNDQCQVSNVP